MSSSLLAAPCCTTSDSAVQANAPVGATPLPAKIQKAQVPGQVTWEGSYKCRLPPVLPAWPRQCGPARTSAWMMFQAFFSPTLFSVWYSSRPSFRSFLAFSFTCQVEGHSEMVRIRTQLISPAHLRSPRMVGDR